MSDMPQGPIDPADPDAPLPADDGPAAFVAESGHEPATGSTRENGKTSAR